MKKSIRFLLFCITLIVVFSQCSKKGDAITEPKIGNYKFTTYTIDTLRFKIVMNDINLGDSLLSPVGTLSANVSFTDTVGNLKIYNAETNQLYIDTTIKLRIGFTTISIVQLTAGQAPFIVPIPNEPPPAAGNYKVRFQYNMPLNNTVPFFDSVQCFIKLSGVVDPVDTIILHQNELSSFYESTLGVNFKMELRNPATGDVIDNNTNNLNSTGFTDFNTASLYGTAPGGVAYNFTLQRIY
jgi:hypothetical protein